LPWAIIDRSLRELNFLRELRLGGMP
jgi:hypothetical protein